MQQKKVELILFRQLGEYLAIPIFIVDADGNLVYYNEGAEKILGFKFSETGEMPINEWSMIFSPQDENGEPLMKEDLPLYISFTQRTSAHSRFHIKNLQNMMTKIEICTFPLINQLNQFLGVVGFFQEISE